MMNTKFVFTLLCSLAFSGLFAQESDVWNPDNGDGTFTNPLINADYSDPDVCKVGDDYYMTASSFGCLPGLQILHSKDLVHWKIVSAAIKDYYPNEVWKTRVQHGNGVYAPSIRYHNGEFFIYYGDPDVGIFMTKTTDPTGEWSPLHLVREGKGFIDPCPLWDENGNAYLVHALAASRAKFNSVLMMAPLSKDGTHLLKAPRIVYDGNSSNPVVEGPKMYKRNGYYYIFAPAGGVSTGWQLVLRSKNIFGPYEEKIVLAKGDTQVNGPHQGAWVTTNSGEDWFFHFQDRGVYGRVVHLQPMVWKEDWPVIGEDKDGDGCGEPMLRVKKPNIASTDTYNPQDTDEFESGELGAQWQWHGLNNPAWVFPDAGRGKLRLYSVPLPEDYKNLASCPNLLLQKFPAEEFTVTAALEYMSSPKSKSARDYGGLIVMGYDYATLAFEQGDKGLFLSMKTCKGALYGKQEEIVEQQPMTQGKVFVRVVVEKGGLCQFTYSTNGKSFKKIGTPFQAKRGRWIGAKVGLFLNRTNNSITRMDVDYFRFTK